MSPRRAAPHHPDRSRLPSWPFIGAIVIVAVIAVVAAGLIMKSNGPTPAVAGDRTAGDPQAPLAFIEYSDFQ